MTQRIPIPSFPYSNLHYSYINPASSYRNRNVEKRQRQKDNYADLYLEKKNYVTYEIDPTASGRFGHSCDNFRPKRELNSCCDIISKSRHLHRNNSYNNVKNDSNNLYMKTLKVLRNRRCSCDCHRKSCNCHASNPNGTINEERMNQTYEVNNNKNNNSSNMKGNNILVRTHSKLLNRTVPKREDIQIKGQKTYVTNSKKGKSLSLPQTERGVKGRTILKKQKLNDRYNEKRIDLNLVANSSHPSNSQRGNDNKENIIYNDNNSNDYRVRNQRQNDYSTNKSNEGSPIQDNSNDVHNNEYESRLREIRKQYKDDVNFDNTNDNSTTFKSTMKSTMRNYKSPSIGNMDQYSKDINDDKLQSHNSVIDNQGQSNIINQVEETMISPRFPEISSEDKERENSNRNTKLKSKQKQTFSFKGNNSQPNEKEISDNIDEYNSDNDNMNNEYEDVNTPQSKVRFGISEKISPIKNQKSPLESSGNKDIGRQIAGSEIERLKRLKRSIQKSSKLNKIKDKAALQNFEKDFKNAKLTSIQQKLKKLSRSSSMKNIDETKFQDKILNYNKEDDFYQEKGIYKKDILGDMLIKIPHHGKYLQTKTNFGKFNQFNKEKRKKGLNFSTSYNILNNSSLCEKVQSNYNARYGSVMPPNPYGSVLKAREFFFFND